jgi:hypothetical protein
MAHHGVVRIYKMEKLFNLLISAFLIFNIPISYAKELYKVPIDYAYRTKDDMKQLARFEANGKRSMRDVQQTKKSTDQAVKDTQRLYYQMDTFRYKAQLQRESKEFKGIFSWLGENMNESYKAARAAQVHWKDLMNAASDRLAIEKINDRRLYDYREEEIRAKQRLDWTRKFRGYAKGLVELAHRSNYFMRGYFDYEADSDKTYALANIQVQEAEAYYRIALAKAESVTEATIKKELENKLTQADRYYQSVVDAHHTFNNNNLLTEEILFDPWIIDQETFNYIVPCDTKDILGVFIVIQGTNRKDVLEKDSDGNLTYKKGVSNTFKSILDMCVAIAIPKSGLSANVTNEGKVTYYRHWWMTDHRPITVSDEIDATINLINVAYEALKKPIYLVHGNDEGILNHKVMNIIKERGEKILYSGTVVFNKDSYELILSDDKGDIVGNNAIKKYLLSKKLMNIMHEYMIKD